MSSKEKLNLNHHKYSLLMEIFIGAHVESFPEDIFTFFFFFAHLAINLNKLFCVK